jgi:hypothetical protein
VASVIQQYDTNQLGDSGVVKVTAMSFFETQKTAENGKWRSI